MHELVPVTRSRASFAITAMVALAPLACRLLFLAGMLCATVAAPRASLAEEARPADATIVVSSGAAASALGLSLVEGTMRHRDKVYRLILRGPWPPSGSTVAVHGLERPRDVEGSYAVTPTAGRLRNDRGVVLVFEPPIDVAGGRLEIELGGRVVPKASAGQRGTVD